MLFQTIYILHYGEKTDFQSSDLYTGTDHREMIFTTFLGAEEEAKKIQKYNSYTYGFWIEKKEVYYLGY